MTEHFSKEEAAFLLGEVFQLKNTFSGKDDSNSNCPVKSGEVGKITGVDFYHGYAQLNIDIYGNYFLFDKADFDYHCQLLKPDIETHISNIRTA